MHLSNSHQRTKINTEYSSWEKTLFGVPQGSLLVPLFFSVFLSDIFLIMDNTDFAIYAGNNMSYTVGNNIEDVIVRLWNTSKAPFELFSDNQMKANQDKYNFIFISNEKFSLIVKNEQIKNNTREKVLKLILLI